MVVCICVRRVNLQRWSRQLVSVKVADGWIMVGGVGWLIDRGVLMDEDDDDVRLP